MQTAVLTMFPGPGALSPAVAGAQQEAAEPAGDGSTTFDAALSSASQGLAQAAGPTNPGQALPLASATPSHARAHAQRPGEAAPTAPERRAAADPSRPAQKREEAGAATSDEAHATNSLPDAQDPVQDPGSDSLAAWLATIVGTTQAVVPRAARPMAPAGGPADASDKATAPRSAPAEVSVNTALRAGSRLVATPGGQGDARTIRSATHASVSAAPQRSHSSRQDRTDPSVRPAAAEIEPARVRHRLPEPTPEQVADPQATATRSPRTADAQSLRRDAQELAEAPGRQATLTPVEAALRGGPAAGRAADTPATSTGAADTRSAAGPFTAATSAAPSAPDASAVSANAATFRPAAKEPASAREPGPIPEAAAVAATTRQPADAPAPARVAAAPNPASQRQEPREPREPRAADLIPLAESSAAIRSDNAPASAAPLAAPATAPTQAAPQPTQAAPQPAAAAAAAAAATPGLSAVMPAGLPAALVPLMASMTAQPGPAAGAPVSPGRAAAAGPLPADPGRSPRNAAAAAVLTDAAASLRVTPQDAAVSGAPPAPVGAWMQALEAAIQTVSPPEGSASVREALAAPGGSSPLAAQVSANTVSPGETLPTESRIDAALQSPEFAPMLGARVTTLVREGVEQARIALNPAEMGPVSVQLELSGSQVRVELAAEVEATRLALEQALPTLAGSLREAGFTLAGGGVFQQARDGGASGRDAGHGTAGEAAAATARSFDLSEAARPAANTGRPRGLVDLYA